jgi:hypothetical protein
VLTVIYNQQSSASLQTSYFKLKVDVQVSTSFELPVYLTKHTQL